MHRPLEQFSVINSRSLDETREIIASRYCQHSLSLVGRYADFDTHYHRVSFGGVSFNYLEYGADVSIDARAFESFYMLEVPISGTAQIGYGKDRIISRGSIASVISTGRPVRSLWTADARRLMVQVNRGVLERFTTDLIGQALTRPIEFNMEMDVSAGAPAGLAEFVRYVFCQIDNRNYFEKYILVRSQVERTLMAMLLTIQPHTYSEHLRAAAAPAAPRFVDRAYEFILDNFASDVTIAQLVEVSGVPARTLFAGFRKHKGISPMGALKRCRLKAARNDLLNPDGGITVTHVAYKWGFSHLGHFAKDYEGLFGEKPSETLHQAR